MENWKSIPLFENYMVSNLGRIKSISRIIDNGAGGRLSKDIILRPNKNKCGYLYVVLSNNSVVKTKTVHQLVAEAFLNHIPCGHKLVVNHIDLNKQNNNLDNLEIITQRENTNKKNKPCSSIYTGVSRAKNRWLSYIRINGHKKYLGSFKSELEASNAYQKELSKISPTTSGLFFIDYKPKTYRYERKENDPI